jgi:hypothetical protein
VAGEQAGRVTNRFGSRRDGRSSLEGFSAAEGISGGEEMAASWSKGHRRGPSGQGGCTRQRGAWGGVEMVGGWLEQDVRGGSIRPERNSGGVAEEQTRALARRSEQLPTSVRSSGR